MDCKDGQTETCVAADLKQRPACDPFTGVAIRIGVMGSAGDGHDASVVGVCHRLGKAIAEAGCTLLTGACGGLPHAAALGAQAVGGRIVGVSPAGSLREHVEVFKSPFKEYDTLIFTGLGFMGRELVNIRSSDIVIVIGGRSGTLGEFAIAYDEGKLIGVLSGTGGITTALPSLESAFAKDTGAEIIYADNPASLVDQLLKRYGSKDYRCPCHPSEKRLDYCNGNGRPDSLISNIGVVPPGESTGGDVGRQNTEQANP